MLAAASHQGQVSLSFRPLPLRHPFSLHRDEYAIWKSTAE